MTKLIDLSVRSFGDQVAADLPAPGGGSAAALAGSVGAGLVCMVCRLSLDREEVEASDAELTEALAGSERLRRRLLELVDEDTAAFEAIMTAIRLPKDTDAERAARSAALAEAKLGAAVPPFETLSAARRVLDLAESLVGRSNANVASDLGVAAHLALAAAEGALLNVAVNVASLPAGEEVERYRRESESEIAGARASAARVAEAVAASLGPG